MGNNDYRVPDQPDGCASNSRLLSMKLLTSNLGAYRFHLYAERQFYLPRRFYSDFQRLTIWRLGPFELWYHER